MGNMGSYVVCIKLHKTRNKFHVATSFTAWICNYYLEVIETDLVDLVGHDEDALPAEGELDADGGLVGGEGVAQLERTGALLSHHDGHLGKFENTFRDHS